MLVGQNEEKIHKNSINFGYFFHCLTAQLPGELLPEALLCNNQKYYFQKYLIVWKLFQGSQKYIARGQKHIQNYFNCDRNKDNFYVHH